MKLKQTRHYCTFCGAKKNQDRMLNIEYRLLRKSGWICRSHASEFADITHIRTPNQQPRFVELFSGSGHISEIAQQWGYETTTIDIEAKHNPDICIDIQNFRSTSLPGSVDVVWASIPCTVYSILNLANHWDSQCVGYRRYHYTPTTPEAMRALRILYKTLDLIKKMKPIFYFIENPRGALRHMPHMKMIPYRKTVSYADYGFKVYKPTDIFTNCPSFQPKEITGAVGRTFEETIADKSNNYERSLVPPGLIHYLFDSIRFLSSRPVGVHTRSVDMAGI